MICKIQKIYCYTKVKALQMINVQMIFCKLYITKDFTNDIYTKDYTNDKRVF